MTDQNAPVRKHHATAKEHLAGIKAARVFYQELTANHLTRLQQPIHLEPIQPPPAEPAP